MRRRARGRCTAVLGLILATFVAPATAETPEELFDRGNEAYRQERWDEAAEAYRAILEYRINDPRVEYNLGNAEFKLGERGRAILHYQRALRLDPTNEDIRNNLALAQSTIVDRADPQELAAPVRWVRELQNRIGPDRQALACLVLVWLVAGVVAWCSARPGGWSPAAGWLLAALLLALSTGAISWRVTYQRLEGKQLAVVLESAVEVLAGPDENNATLFTVHEGLTLEIRAQRGEWLQASLPNGLNGWLPRDSVGEV